MIKEKNELQNELYDIYDPDNLISEPTFFKKPEGTLIDPILVRNAVRFKKSINVFCGYSDWHQMVGCITNLQITPAKSHKVTYSSLKYFDENTFKEDVSHIPFQICNIFDDVSDQYWATNWLFTEVLNEQMHLVKKEPLKKTKYHICIPT